MVDNFDKILKNGLEKSGLSIMELSQKTGISQLVLNYYLSGRSRPDTKSRERILKALEK